MDDISQDSQEESKTALDKNFCDDKEDMDIQGRLKEMGKWRLADKLFKLMSDAYSRQLFSRQDHVMEEFLQYFRFGFPLRDVPTISNILGTLIDRYSEHEKYLNHASRILEIIAENGFKKEQMLDEIKYVIPVSNILSLFGYYLLKNPPASLQKSLIITLLALSRNKKTPQNSCDELSCEEKTVAVVPVSEHFMVLCFENSSLSITLVKILQQIDENFLYLLELVITTFHFSKMSEKNCEYIVDNNGIPTVCVLMNVIQDYDNRNRVKFWCSELLSLFISNYPNESSKILSRPHCIKLIREAFLDTLVKNSGIRLKQLRNDFLLLLSQILQLNPNKVVLPITLITELTVLAYMPEVQMEHELASKIQYEETAEDYEMKQLLFCILHLLKSPEYFPMINSAKLMECLLTHLYPLSHTINTNPHTISISMEYKRTLQILALQTLSYFVPIFLDAFLQQDAVTLLLKQIHWCIGKGFLRERKRIYERDTYFRFCLQILVKVIDTHSDVAITQLIDLRMMPVMMKVLSDTLNLPYETQYVDFVVKIQCLAFVILAAMCDNRGEFQIVIGSVGETLLIEYLKKLCTRENIALPGHSMLATAVVNCVRCCIVGKCSLEYSFNIDKGPHLLLDLLMTAHPAVQSLILACLIDLSSSKEIVQNVLGWRGPNKITSPALLCKLWREEEERLGIKREQPVLLSRRPSLSTRSFYGSGKFLMGKYQLSLTLESLTSDELSAAVLDACENFRANIFGLIECMKDVNDDQGSEDVHPPELVRLSMDDMPTMAIIEGYLDLKGGEVWTELLSELKEEKLNPLPEEQEYIYSVLRMITNRAGIIMGFQRQFRYLQNDNERIAEGAYYNQYHQWKDEDKIRQRKTAEYLGRTSNVATMKKAKEKDRLEINLEQEKCLIKRLEEKKPQRISRNYVRH